MAAHQWRVASGQPGYVDAAGRLNSAYDDDAARIRAFRELGAESDPGWRIREVRS